LLCSIRRSLPGLLEIKDVKTFTVIIYLVHRKCSCPSGKLCPQPTNIPGRIAGQDGKTKFTIENASRTRIVLPTRRFLHVGLQALITVPATFRKIHIMGSFQNIKLPETPLFLILGSPQESLRWTEDSEQSYEAASVVTTLSSCRELCTLY